MRRIASLFLAASLAVSAQEMPQGGSQQVFVTAIEIVADVRDASGNVPSGLTPADFVVIEDGVERAVVGVDYLRVERLAAAPGTAPAAPATPATASAPPRWQNLIYFETTLANGTGRVSAAREMMKHVDALVAMGTVDVVFANPIPTPLVRNSRDAAAIRAALEKVATSGGSNQLAAQRREYLRDVSQLGSLEALKGRTKTQTPVLEYPSAGQPRQPSGGGANAPTMNTDARNAFDGTTEGVHSTLNANKILPYIEQEVRFITHFRESLMAWLSSYRRHVPRNLLLVTDGFDLDPVEFYGASASNTARADLRKYVSQSTLGVSADRMAEALSAGAWTTVSIPSDNNADGWVDDSTVSGIGRMGTYGKKSAGSPKAFFYRPHDPLNNIAEATGGKVVANSAQLPAVLASLDDRIKLTYQVDRKPDGKTRKIEVRSRKSNLKVRSARFAASASPDAVAEARAVGLLKSANYQGDLPTEGSVEWSAAAGPKKSGTLRAVTKIDLVKSLLPPGAKGQFRITLAVQMGKEAVVVNRAVPDSDMTEGVFRFRTPLDLPATATAIVLVIEETTTGVWGSTRVDIPPATVPASSERLPTCVRSWFCFCRSHLPLPDNSCRKQAASRFTSPPSKWSRTYATSTERCRPT